MMNDTVPIAEVTSVGAQPFQAYCFVPPEFTMSDLSNAGVWREVYEQNIYHLPERLDEATVVDVGGHVGSFTAACLSRGAKRVVVAEPCAASCAELWETLASYPNHNERVRLVRAAVVGDATVGTAHLAHDPAGYSCSHSLVPEIRYGPGETVRLVTLADLCRELETVDLLKLDCEGCEYAIVERSPDVLKRCQAVIVETHRVRDCAARERLLVGAMEGARLTLVRVDPCPWTNVLFFSRSDRMFQ